MTRLSFVFTKGNPALVEQRGRGDKGKFSVAEILRVVL